MFHIRHDSFSPSSIYMNFLRHWFIWSLFIYFIEFVYILCFFLLYPHVHCCACLQYTNPCWTAQNDLKYFGINRTEILMCVGLGQDFKETFLHQTGVMSFNNNLKNYYTNKDNVQLIKIQCMSQIQLFFIKRLIE